MDEPENSVPCSREEIGRATLHLLSAANTKGPWAQLAQTIDKTYDALWVMADPPTEGVWIDVGVGQAGMEQVIIYDITGAEEIGPVPGFYDVTDTLGLPARVVVRGLHAGWEVAPTVAITLLGRSAA
jgi:hypothetical protein